jgi:hypothetical protein
MNASLSPSTAPLNENTLLKTQNTSEPSIAGLVMGIITGALVVSVALYYSSYFLFGYLAPHHLGSVWPEIGLFIECLLLSILASIIGLISFIICLVKRKSMKKGAFIAGVCTSLSPVALLVFVIVPTLGL